MLACLCYAISTICAVGGGGGAMKMMIIVFPVLVNKLLKVWSEKTLLA